MTTITRISDNSVLTVEMIAYGLETTSHISATESYTGRWVHNHWSGPDSGTASFLASTLAQRDNILHYLRYGTIRLVDDVCGISKKIICEHIKIDTVPLTGRPPCYVIMIAWMEVS